jgi:ATP-dependent Lon protease
VTENAQHERIIEIPGELPILPLTGTVVYPLTVTALLIAQPAAVRLIDAALAEQAIIGCFARTVGQAGDPQFALVGAAVRIHVLVRLPDGALRVAAEGIERIRINEIVQHEPFLRGHISLLPDTHTAHIPPELVQTVAGRTEELLSLIRDSSDLRAQIRAEEDLRRLSFLAAQAILMRRDLAERQAFLEMHDLRARLTLLANAATRELRALRRIIPTAAYQNTPLVGHEPTQSSAASESLNTLSKPIGDIGLLRHTLAEQVVGLQEARQIVLERLAARELRRRRGQASSPPHEPVLCLVGPAGCGKSTLIRAIAQAAGQQYARIALDTVFDADDIWGRPGEAGAILRAITRSGVEYPLIELDGIDQLSAGPVAALARVLDPQERSDFRDRALGARDLAPLLFMVSARNEANIPAVLRERLEVVRIGALNSEEKLEIAQRMLLANQIDAYGLLPGEIVISDTTMHSLVESCATDPGVYSLERLIAALCRLAALRIASRPMDGEHEPITF